MSTERACANTLPLPVVPRRQPPRGDYEIVHESDYEMNTVAGRIAWFCDEFEIERPALPMDPEHRGEEEAILVTDEVLAWFEAAGLPLDFAFTGSVKDLLAAYRKNALQTQEIVKCASKMEPQISAAFTAMLRAIVDHGVPMKDAFATFEMIAGKHRAAT